jgi:hypothetical protein
MLAQEQLCGITPQWIMFPTMLLEADGMLEKVKVSEEMKVMN